MLKYILEALLPRNRVFSVLKVLVALANVGSWLDLKGLMDASDASGGETEFMDDVPIDHPLSQLWCC